MAAGCGYLLLVAMLSVAAELGASWRLTLLGSLALPVAAWWRSRTAVIDTSLPPQTSRPQRLPRAFWCAAAIIVDDCRRVVGHCVGATFVQRRPTSRRTPPSR